MRYGRRRSLRRRMPKYSKRRSSRRRVSYVKGRRQRIGYRM